MYIHRPSTLKRDYWRKDYQQQVYSRTHLEKKIEQVRKETRERFLFMRFSPLFSLNVSNLNGVYRFSDRLPSLLYKCDEIRSTKALESWPR